MERYWKKVVGNICSSQLESNLIRYIVSSILKVFHLHVKCEGCNILFSSKPLNALSSNFERSLTLKPLNGISSNFRTYSIWFFDFHPLHSFLVYAKFWNLLAFVFTLIRRKYCSFNIVFVFVDVYVSFVVV